MKYIPFLFFLVSLLTSCKDDQDALVQKTFFNDTTVVRNLSQTQMRTNSATAVGSVRIDVSYELVSRNIDVPGELLIGVICATSPDPTHSTAGVRSSANVQTTATGAYTARITGVDTRLNNYWLRAFAQDSRGTYHYGNTISLNGQTNPTTGDLVLSQSSIAFQPQYPGNQTDVNILATNTSTSPLTVSVDPRPNGFWLVAPSSSPFVIPAGQSQTLTIRFLPPQVANYSGAFTFRYGNNFVRQLSVSGSGVAQPTTTTLSISPSQLNFGSILTGETTSQTVLLTNTGSITANYSFGSINSYFSSSPQTGSIPPGGSVPVTFTFTPGSTAGSRSGTANLTWNGGNGSVSMVGAANAATRIIGLNMPQGTNYGNVAINTSVSRTLAISNSGNSTLTINSITVGSPTFTCTWSGTIASGQTVQVPVTFRPVTRNVNSGGNISVSSNKTSGTSTLYVSGRGI